MPEEIIEKCASKYVGKSKQTLTYELIMIKIMTMRFLKRTVKLNQCNTIALKWTKGSLTHSKVPFYIPEQEAKY